MKTLFLVLYRFSHVQIFSKPHPQLTLTFFNFLQNSFSNISFKSSFEKRFDKKETHLSIDKCNLADWFALCWSNQKRKKKWNRCGSFLKLFMIVCFPSKFKIRSIFRRKWRKKKFQKEGNRKEGWTHKRRMNEGEKKKGKKKEKISKKGQNGAFSRFRIFKRIFSAIMGLKINISFFPVFQLRAKKLKYKSSKLLKREEKYVWTGTNPSSRMNEKKHSSFFPSFISRKKKKVLNLSPLLTFFNQFFQSFLAFCTRIDE